MNILDFSVSSPGVVLKSLYEDNSEKAKADYYHECDGKSVIVSGWIPERQETGDIDQGSNGSSKARLEKIQ